MATAEVLSPRPHSRQWECRPSPLKRASATVVEVDSENEDASQEDNAATETSAFLTATHLTTSPYSDLENQTQLLDLNLPVRLLSFALTIIRPIRPDYATAPYLESFNWSACFERLRQLCVQARYAWLKQDLYLVIFRSKLKQDADRAQLGELDKHSHAEACASGGLLMYWFGECDADMRNLATCIWRNREDAAAGGRGPWHAKARQAARHMYESITFETYTFTIGDGAASWEIKKFT